MCHEQWALHADIKREFFYRYIYYNNHWFFWLIFFIIFCFGFKRQKGEERICDCILLFQMIIIVYSVNYALIILLLISLFAIWTARKYNVPEGSANLGAAINFSSQDRRSRSECPLLLELSK